MNEIKSDVSSSRALGVLFLVFLVMLVGVAVAITIWGTQS